MKTNLPALVHAHDAERRPDPRFYDLARAMLRGHPDHNCYENRGLLAVAMWMEARNTLDHILAQPVRPRVSR